MVVVVGSDAVTVKSDGADALAAFPFDDMNTALML
jgi:hypothetical protein